MTILKAEIHCHIEGATPPSLARQKAKQYGIPIDGLITPDGESYVATDFSRFLAAYDRVVKLFRTAADFADLSYAHFTAIAREGAIYGEVFLSRSGPFRRPPLWRLSGRSCRWSGPRQR